MPEWRIERETDIDGVAITIRRESLRRCPDRIISCRINGELVHSERVDNSTWEGHCGGQLLLPKIIEKAKIKANGTCEH